ncbi:hypothetical protein [Paraburkholderia bannensis]|uniref:hypothetical protein n=1 Tax=Paraburkholderia bannensis TaxID=765414 RepID=UPI0012EC33D8|nr:hypothetical protein [Paraburkholderia bannensis]
MDLDIENAFCCSGSINVDGETLDARRFRKNTLFANSFSTAVDDPKSSREIRLTTAAAYTTVATTTEVFEKSRPIALNDP